MNGSASKQGAPPRATSHRTLTYWRERTLRVLLASVCVLGLLAYVPSVWVALRSGLWGIVLFDTLVYAWFVVMTLRSGATYALRAASICGLSYLLGVTLLVRLGLPSTGILWMSSVPVMVALLVGVRAARVAIAVNTATFVLLAGLAAAGLWRFTGAADGGLGVFLVAAGNATLLSAAVALSVGILLRGLEEGHQALSREIADRTRAEDERQRLEDQLREAHQLEAVGRLASGVAHDFNNLLVPILANAEQLRRAAPQAECDMGLVDDIIVSAARGRDLVQRVLAFSRRAITTRAPMRVADVMREAAQLLRAGLRPDIAIDLDIGAEHGTVLADSVELHQVVMNLCTNAAHAMRTRGGRLTLSLHTGPGPDTLTMTVRDTGEGMSASVRDRAFDPFFTTKALGEGSGLGLSTVQAIVVDLGGDVVVESTQGRGTAVRVTLPALPPERSGPAKPPASVAPPPSAEPSATSRPRVLVVDDDVLVLKTCSMLLDRLGYAVTTMNDPREAALRLSDEDAVFDLLVTDKAMPGMDGLALARHARSVDTALPIILVTGFVDDATMVAMRGLGQAQILTKPYRMEELAEAASMVRLSPAAG